MGILKKLKNIFSKNIQQNSLREEERKSEWNYYYWEYEEITNSKGITYSFAKVDKNTPEMVKVFRDEMIKLHLAGRLEIGERNEFKYIFSKSAIHEINHGEAVQKAQELFQQISIIEFSKDYIEVNYQKKKFGEQHGISYDDYKQTVLSLNKESIQNIDNHNQKQVADIIFSLNEIKQSSNYVNVDLGVIEKLAEKEEVKLTLEDMEDIKFLGKEKALEMKKRRLMK